MKDYPCDAKNSMALDSSSLQASRIRFLPPSERCNRAQNHNQNVPLKKKPAKKFLGDLYQKTHRSL